MGLGAGYGIVLIALAGTVQPPQISWSAPPQCPQAQDVEQELARLFVQAGVEVTKPVQVRGSLYQDPRGDWLVALSLEVDGQRTNRTLAGPSCQELGAAVAFVVATAVDPRVGAVALPGEPTPAQVAAEVSSTTTELDPTTVAPDPPGAEAAGERGPGGRATLPLERESGTGHEPAGPEGLPRAKPSRRPRRSRTSPRLGVSLGLDGGLGYGPNPRFGGVVGGHVGLRAQRWRADLLADYWTPSTSSPAFPSGAQIRVQAWSLGARGCWVPRIDPFEFPLCLGLGSGALVGEGRGTLANQRRTSVAWVRGVAGPGVYLRLSPAWAIGARVDGSVTVASGGFRTDPTGRIHQARLGGVAGGLSLEFRPR